MSEATPVIVMNESILDAIEALFGDSKNDILRAIAISKVGHKHVEQWNTELIKDVNLLADNIKPLLPNSRMLILVQLTWPGTEPDLSWLKIKGNSSAEGIVLSTVQGAKVKTSDYEFDEPVTRGTEYNIQSDQDCTLTYLLIIEYAMGF